MSVKRALKAGKRWWRPYTKPSASQADKVKGLVDSNEYWHAVAQRSITEAQRLREEHAALTESFADLLRHHTRASWAMRGEGEYPEDERDAAGARASEALRRARGISRPPDDATTKEGATHD